MSDLFHPNVKDEWLHEIFNVMFMASATNHNGHTFQLLTKRPARMLDWMRKWTDYTGKPLGPNCPRIWVGVSVWDQNSADAFIPLLLKTPAAVRWVSVEPMLGPIDLEQSAYKAEMLPESEGLGLDWIVCGGESGPGARPIHPGWVRSLRDQCVNADVPFLFKQWGEWGACRVGDHLSGNQRLYLGDGDFIQKVGKKATGRILDGRTWDEYPANKGN